MPDKQGTERRRRNRLAIKVPVRVRGREPSGTAWEEVAGSLDASESGLAIVMSRPVRTGQVLHLSVPLPPRFRHYDLASSYYRIYGLVRECRPIESRSRVGVMFLGPNPPHGSEPLPSGLFRLPGDREAEAAPASEAVASLVLRLEAEEAPGGLAQQETAEVERLTATTAVVTVKALPVGRGSVLTLEEVGGAFRSRAEVTIISIDAAGRARLVLAVLDGTIPERLLADDGATQH
jgi:hypothetical protein